MSATPHTSLTGHLLIAMPAMLDPNFHRTVSYICEHGEQGAAKQQQALDALWCDAAEHGPAALPALERGDQSLPHLLDEPGYVVPEL